MGADNASWISLDMQVLQACGIEHSQYNSFKTESTCDKVAVYRAVIVTIYSTDNVGALLLGVLNSSFQTHS